MKNSTIILNQCETDIRELRKDIDAGLYEENTEGFLKETDRIMNKMEEATEVKNFEREQDQIEAEERMAEEKQQEEELTDMFGEGGKEEVKEFYEAEKFDYHPRPEEEELVAA